MVRIRAGARTLGCCHRSAALVGRYHPDPFCGERDHENLASLVSEGPAQQTVDVCEQCRHYVKALTILAPIRPEDVFLQDLATLVLDVTALERGHRRPEAKARRVALIAAPSPLHTLFRLPRWTTG